MATYDSNFTNVRNISHEKKLQKRSAGDPEGWHLFTATLVPPIIEIGRENRHLWLLRKKTSDYTYLLYEKSKLAA